MSKTFVVTFKPQDTKVTVAQGTDLLSAAFKAGLPLASNCGGEGLCGKCRVIVTKGKVTTEPTRLIPEREREKGAVLACEALVESDLTVMIPPGSLEVVHPGAKETGGTEEFSKGVQPKAEELFRRAPIVRKVYVEVASPTTDDNTSDLDRICGALKLDDESVFTATRLANVKHLGDLLRESDFKVTVTLCYKDHAVEIAAIESGDTTGRLYAFAFDIGTTTVTGELIDLGSGEILGTRIAYNRQARYGADVITRIIYASESKGLEALNDAILDNINEMVVSLATASAVALSDVYAAVIAGNTTMMHLLLKIDPSHIRKEPYVSTVTTFPVVNAGEAGIMINPKGAAFCLPAVSTYIGGDTVAGVLSSALFKEDDLALLVDIGTNGEIVLGNKEWMMACAASAGPAFEGSGLGFGMKAVAGAIQKVTIDAAGSVACETIGGASPRGICGSGYISILEQLLRRGIMGKDGKLVTGAAGGRVRRTTVGNEFIVSRGSENGIGADITISEDDIENLKRSKAAIYSAIVALLNKVGKDIADIERYYIAGGFGSALDIPSAVAIGLLPDVPRERYAFIGNSSLAGARLALLSRDALEATNAIFRNITYLDLSAEAQYMDEYVAALFFPHTDIRRFPSARS